MDLQATRKLANTFDGWLSDIEGELLYNLAKNCSGKGVIVEIGSWKGKSTTYLANGSEAGNNVPIYAIDPHIGSPENQVDGPVWTFDEFQNNIKQSPASKLVTPLVKTSEAAAAEITEPVEVIFIDGAHEYEMVALDFDLWFDKVIDGGWMAFHDTTYSWEGPRRLVAERVYTSNRFRHARYAGTITYAQKVAQNTLWDRVQNRYVLFVKDLRVWLRKLRLPAPVRKVGNVVEKLLLGK